MATELTTTIPQARGTSTTTRRLFLASAPAAAAFIGHSGALDPIFATIKRHKATMAAYCLTEEDTQESEDALNAEIAALHEFLETVPLTVAGMRAGLEHVVSIDMAYYAKDFVATILQSPLLTA